MGDNPQNASVLSESQPMPELDFQPLTLEERVLIEMSDALPSEAFRVKRGSGSE